MSLCQEEYHSLSFLAAFAKAVFAVICHRDLKVESFHPELLEDSLSYISPLWLVEKNQAVICRCWMFFFYPWQQGDVKGYLRSCTLPDPLLLQRMACEITSGLLHLHKNNFFHRCANLLCLLYIIVRFFSIVHVIIQHCFIAALQTTHFSNGYKRKS